MVRSNKSEDATPFWKVLAREYIALRRGDHATGSPDRSDEAVNAFFADMEKEALSPNAQPRDGESISVLSAPADPNTEEERLEQARLNRCTQAVVGRIHADRYGLTALCLSGGGTRSATFNLGVVQALAAGGLLGKIDYLSTVSGGGYLGSWLSAWIHRHVDGINGAQRELHRESSAGAPAEDPDEVRYLREYSNFLTPRVGIASLDMWTVIATYVRNLLLNALIIVPAILAAIFMAWLYVAALNIATRVPGSDALDWVPLLERQAFPALMSIFSLAAAYGLRPSIVAQERLLGDLPPKTDQHQTRRDQRARTLAIYGFVIVPMSLFMLTAPAASLMSYTRIVARSSAPEIAISNLIAAAIATVFSALIEAYRTSWSSTLRRTPWTLLLFFCAMYLPALISMGSDRALLTYLGQKDSSFHLGWYAAVSPPLRLGAIWVFLTLLVGLTSEQHGLRREADREWLGRLMGIMLRLSVMHFIIIALAVCLPMHFLAQAVDSSRHPLSISAASAGLAGVIAALGGLSGRTAALRNRVPRDLKAKFREVTPELAAGVFVALMCLFLAMLASQSLAAFHPEKKVVTEVKDADGTTRRVPKTLTTLELLAEHPVAATLPAEHQGDAAIMVLNKAPSSPFSEATNCVAISAGAAILISLCFGHFINVNRFSLHGAYRNRLTRAYLGASRGDARDPDPFTGFDSEDNLNLYALSRAAAIRPKEIEDVHALCSWIHEGTMPLAAVVQEAARKTGQLHLIEHVAAEDVASVVEVPTGDDPDADVRRLLANVLTGLLDGTELRKDAPANLFSGDSALAKLDARSDELPNRRLRNRLILEAVLPRIKVNPANEKSSSTTPTIIGSTVPRPYHVLNAALNLVGSNRLAWQERKAESFAFTPMYCGYGEAYRSSIEYGDGVSLGTAMAISGAAASPNMGYHSSPLVGLAMTMLNVRLGWWLGNTRTDLTRRPIARALQSFGITADRFQVDSPRWAPNVLFAEALGDTDDLHPYVYLSDGGHFDNLGVYEMVRRRCRMIVVCDASSDPKTDLSDLANVIRKIRIDLGIRITLRRVNLKPRRSDKQKPPVYCNVGRIYYGDRDRMPVTRDGESIRPGENVGHLIYIKPTIRGDEPLDVYNYARSVRAFPHESTADQWFSESQFESYRVLGETIMSAVIAQAKATASRSAGDHFLSMAELYKFLDASFEKEIAGQSASVTTPANERPPSPAPEAPNSPPGVGG